MKNQGGTTWAKHLIHTPFASSLSERVRRAYTRDSGMRLRELINVKHVAAAAQGKWIKSRECYLEKCIYQTYQFDTIFSKLGQTMSTNNRASVLLLQLFGPGSKPLKFSNTDGDSTCWICTERLSWRPTCETHHPNEILCRIRRPQRLTVGLVWPGL